MEQPPHPAIGYRSDDDTLGLAATAEPGRQSRPPLVGADQAMGSFHQQGSHFIVAGLDEARIGLPLATRTTAKSDLTNHIGRDFVVGGLVGGDFVRGA